MLDTMIVDMILNTPGLLAVIRRAHDEGRAEFLVTHIQLDEISRAPKAERRAQLLDVVQAIGARIELAAVGTCGGDGIPGSPLDGFRVTDEETAARVAGHRGGGIGHRGDATIAETARQLGAALVTDEKRSGAFGRDFPDLVVWSGAEFIAFLEGEPTPDDPPVIGAP